MPTKNTGTRCQQNSPIGQPRGKLCNVEKNSRGHFENFSFAVIAYAYNDVRVVVVRSLSICRRLPFRCHLRVPIQLIWHLVVNKSLITVKSVWFGAFSWISTSPAVQIGDRERGSTRQNDGRGFP